MDVKNLGIHYLQINALPSKCRVVLVVDIEYDRVTEAGDHKIEAYIVDADGNKVMSPIVVEEEFTEEAEAFGFYRQLNPVFRKYGAHRVEILVDKQHFASIPLTIAPKRKADSDFAKGRICFDAEDTENELARDKSRLAERIWAYSELGMLDEALIEAKKLIKIDPEDPDSSLDPAICYEHAGRFDEAIKCYKEVIRNFPKDSRAYVNLGFLFEKYKKRNDLAIVCYEKAFQLNPEDEWALNNIGAILQKQSKWKEALDWY
ncbi:MAG: tetratricopeptide repeat protein, partial [Candidatus Omnitrophica bacterium]|nr:tetratricopeptide repeat protein [Candidatus Omnitrophota bacterium]